MTPAAPLSIGMPVYNGARFLAETLDSLLSQSFGDFDLLISDNASTDETPDICADAAARDARVRVHRQEHTISPPDNYNWVFHHTEGRLFKWAAHDDVCAPSYLERCVDVLDGDPDVVAAHARTVFFDADGSVLFEDTVRPQFDQASPVRRFASLLRQPIKQLAVHELFSVVRRNVLATTRLHGRVARGDDVTIAELALRGRIRLVDEVLFFNRRHGASSTGDHGRPTRPGSWLSRKIGGGPKPTADWFDPALRGRIVFPEWRIVREYARAVEEAPLSAADRRACRLVVAQFAARLAPRLGRDAAIGGEQAFRLLAAGRAPWHGGLDRLPG